jgi:hypothetical protein
MATIKARRRPIRDGVERSNERNRRISQIPLAPAENNVARKRRSRKMVPLEQPVEGAAKNSNAAIGRRSIHSGIIAAIKPARAEFSLRKYTLAGAISRS